MVVGHLADAARVNLGRIHAKAAGGEPVGDWDPEAMVARFGYSSVPVEYISAEFRARREAFVSAARALLAKGLDRAYLVGRLDATREHDGEHLRQLGAG